MSNTFPGPIYPGYAERIAAGNFEISASSPGFPVSGKFLTFSPLAAVMSGFRIVNNAGVLTPAPIRKHCACVITTGFHTAVVMELHDEISACSGLNVSAQSVLNTLHSVNYASVPADVQVAAKI